MADKCFNKKRIVPTILCTGDLKHKVQIQLRELIEADFDDEQPTEVFTLVRYQWCAIETIEGIRDAIGVAKFAGINIETWASHRFWTKWDSGFPDLENGNHFLYYDSKRYKVLKVSNVNELNTTMGILCIERGEDSEEATKA